MPKTPANAQSAPHQSSSQLRLPDYAAARLLTSQSTLAKWRSAGIGPAFVKISGGRVAYEDAELDRFIASRRVATKDSGAAV